MPNCYAIKNSSLLGTGKDQEDTRDRVRYCLDRFESSSRLKLGSISHAVRVSPQIANRMIDAARSILNRFIPDIYLYSDVYKGDDSGKYVTISVSKPELLLNYFHLSQITWLRPHSPSGVHHDCYPLC